MSHGTIGAGGQAASRGSTRRERWKVRPESAEGPSPAPPATAGAVSRRRLPMRAWCSVSSTPGNFAATASCSDPELALAALRPIAERMGVDLATAAHGVLTVCREAMAEAIRLVTVRRGIDPRGFALVVLGGAGPVHGGPVARLLGISTVIVPALTRRAGGGRPAPCPHRAGRPDEAFARGATRDLPARWLSCAMRSKSKVGRGWPRPRRATWRSPGGLSPTGVTSANPMRSKRCR